MTDTPEKTKAPTPIQDWENQNARGVAKMCKTFHEEHMDKVKKLRERQEAFEASLPNDPIEALVEINNVLRDTDMGSILEPQFGPRAALEIIYQLASHGVLNDVVDMSEPLHWLASQALDGLKITEDAHERAVKIAHKFHPGHVPFRA